MLRTSIALLSALLLLALPGAALAQSAGDDQYSDPFGDTEQPAGGGDQPVDDGDSVPQQSAPTSDPAPSTAKAVTDADAGTLPRTGFEVVLLIAAAFPLLVGGIALRRVAS